VDTCGQGGGKATVSGKSGGRAVPGLGGSVAGYLGWRSTSSMSACMVTMSMCQHWPRATSWLLGTTVC
jgi:hypothetical protein